MPATIQPQGVESDEASTAVAPEVVVVGSEVVVVGADEVVVGADVRVVGGWVVVVGGAVVVTGGAVVVVGGWVVVEGRATSPGFELGGRGVVEPNVGRLGIEGMLMLVGTDGRLGRGRDPDPEPHAAKPAMAPAIVTMRMRREAPFIDGRLRDGCCPHIVVGKGVPDVQRIVRRVDAYQQRHPSLAFPYAVVKKFGDDRGDNLTALLTYYTFVSLFPLLLVGVTVLGYVLHDDPHLQQRILDSALSNFPIVGDQIRANITTVRGNGVALVIGILVALYGGLGIANVAQHALNRIWGVPGYARPGFFPRLGRSLGLIGTLGVAILVTTVLSGIGGGVASNLGTSIAISLAAIVCNTALFTIAFQVMIVSDVAWRDLLPGAILVGIAWEVLQRIGSFYVSRVLQGMSQLYGLFALVLGLLVWISLEARVVLYGAEINAVRAHKLWPRSITTPLTDADRRADLAYVRNAERHRTDQLENRATRGGRL